MNIVNGTHYADDTLQEIVDVLEEARAKQWRIRIHYGNPYTGCDWNEDYDVTGRIGRSMGPIKVPILLYRRGSMCGSPIPDHRIVRIHFSNMEKCRGDDLYLHPRYHGEAA